MTANSNVTQFVADLGAISPTIIDLIGQTLNLLLQPPLVIFTSIAVIYAGFRIGMSLWQRLKH
jgi:hypothetical protein